MYLLLVHRVWALIKPGHAWAPYPYPSTQFPGRRKKTQGHLLSRESRNNNNNTFDEKKGFFQPSIFLSSLRRCLSCFSFSPSIFLPLSLIAKGWVDISHCFSANWRRHEDLQKINCGPFILWALFSWREGVLEVLWVRCLLMSRFRRFLL